MPYTKTVRRLQAVALTKAKRASLLAVGKTVRTAADTALRRQVHPMEHELRCIGGLFSAAVYHHPSGWPV